MKNEAVTRVRIWDLPTRVFHWSLALSFCGAYLLAESERVRHLHVMFGYTVFALIVLRLIWGFIGTRYARFRSFAYGPREVVDHLKEIARRDVSEHVGHTPAGSWAIWLMLLLALVTAVSGYLRLNEIGGEVVEEMHEAAANGWLFIVFVHIAGVIVSSIVERQDLARSMVTGYKKLGGQIANVRNQSIVGALLLVGIAMFWGTTTLSGKLALLPFGTVTHHLRESPRLSSKHDAGDDPQHENSAGGG